MGRSIPGSGGAAGEAGVAGDESNPNCYELDHQFDADILRAIQRNMDSLGFQQVPTEQSPDVVVVPGVSANDNWYLFYPWCNYYWPGYCYYYPWTPTAVNYPVGSLVMYMVAPNEADAAAEQLPVAWLGIVRGLISSSSDLDLSRLNANVNQAFAQSQYLGEGK